MTQVNRLTKITSQLVGDIGRLEGVQLDQSSEAQLVQLLTDAFEQVGYVALDQADASLLGLEGTDRGCALANCAVSYPHSHSASPPGNA